MIPQRLKQRTLNRWGWFNPSVRMGNAISRTLRKNGVNICYNKYIREQYRPGYQNILLALESPAMVEYHQWLDDDMEFVAEISFKNFYNLSNYRCCRTLYVNNDNFLGMDDAAAPKKEQLVSMMYSELDFLPGHKLRHRVADRFRDKIHLFGSGTGRFLQKKFMAPHFFQVVIENEFYWKGFEKSSFERVSRRLWIALSKQSDVIFDIGANTGLYTLLSQHVHPDAVVYAFEPIERNLQKMRYNCRINGMDNVRYVLAAASNRNGRQTIFVPETEVSTTSTLQREVAGNLNIDHPVEIETITLDTFIERNKISDVDLVKIDVEGHEVSVLQGFVASIGRYKPTILAEIRVEEHGHQISEILDGHGYLYFDIDEVHAPTRVDALQKSTYNNFLICTPEIARQLQLTL